MTPSEKHARDLRATISLPFFGGVRVRRRKVLPRAGGTGRTEPSDLLGLPNRLGQGLSLDAFVATASEIVHCRRGEQIEREVLMRQVDRSEQVPTGIEVIRHSGVYRRSLVVRRGRKASRTIPRPNNWRPWSAHQGIFPPCKQREKSFFPLSACPSMGDDVRTFDTHLSTQPRRSLLLCPPG